MKTTCGTNTTVLIYTNLPDIYIYIYIYIIIKRILFVSDYLSIYLYCIYLSMYVCIYLCPSHVFCRSITFWQIVLWKPLMAHWKSNKIWGGDWIDLLFLDKSIVFEVTSEKQKHKSEIRWFGPRSCDKRDLPSPL